MVGTAHARSALAQEALVARVNETNYGTSGFTLEEIFGVAVLEPCGLVLSHSPLDVLEEPDPDRRIYRQRSLDRPQDRDRSRSPGAEGRAVLTFRPRKQQSRSQTISNPGPRNQQSRSESTANLRENG